MQITNDHVQFVNEEIIPLSTPQEAFSQKNSTGAKHISSFLGSGTDGGFIPVLWVDKKPSIDKKT